MRGLVGMTLAVALLACDAAAAAPSARKAIWGPVRVDGVSQFPIYERLGAGILQMTLPWDAVARSRPARPRDPADPAYAWPAEIDEALALGAGRGVRIALMVTNAPRWANGGRDRRWAPADVSRYADFVEAASRRYPAVSRWVIWGEPTKPSNFQPLPPDRRRPLRTAAELRGPRRYARLLDAAYARLKSVQRSDLVVGGNSYTVGAVRPLYWIRALRLPDGRPPRMDLYGHNPFTLRRPLLSQPPLGAGYADFGDLDRLIAVLDRWLARGTRNRRLRVFISEFTVPTDHANHEFNFFTTRETQARWIRDALREVRRTPRIATLGYLGLYDDAVRADGRQVERGLLQRDGTEKPAFTAFADG